MLTLFTERNNEERKMQSRNFEEENFPEIIPLSSYLPITIIKINLRIREQTVELWINYNSSAVI